MTSKDYLSQEEIDALLRQSSSDTDDSSSVGDSVSLDLDQYISPLEQDALGEIGNITFGSAATALSTLLGKKVDITTPTVSLVRKHELGDVFPKPHVAVSVEYVDGFEGINSLVIRTQDAQIIADLMLGGDGIVTEQELNDIHISAVQEAMNQMMGSSATSMSTIFNRLVNISPPGINILDVESGDGLDYLPSDDVMIKISFHLKIADLIDSTIMQLLPVPFARQMVNTLMGAPADEVMEVVEATVNEVNAQMTSSQPSAPAPVQQASVEQQAQQPMQQPMQQPAYVDNNFAPPVQPQYQYPPQNPYGQPAAYDAMPKHGHQPQRHVNVQPVQFANFNQGGVVPGDGTNLNLLLDIPLKVTVELGRTQKQIKDILELSQGSIIELDKLAGEPVDILVNNKLIAKGEVVVIDENFGVRVTDIVSQWDRIQKLQ